MRNAGLEETEEGIRIAGRTLNNLRYADDKDKGNGKEDWCLLSVDREEDADGGMGRKENERIDTAADL